MATAPDAATAAAVPAAAAATATAAAADPRAAACRQLRELISGLEAPGGAALLPPALLTARLRAIAAQLEGGGAADAAAGGAARVGVSPADIERLERSYQATTSAAAAAATALPPAATGKKERRRGRRGGGGLNKSAVNGGGLDFSKYRQRNVALHVMYFGGGYQGLARQADSENTIEGHLFNALRQVRLIPADAEPGALGYTRCGRTDKGVSALGQVLSLRLRSKARTSEPPLAADEETDFAGSINRALPDDIRVLGWADVDGEFNARFSCLGRRYKYFIVQDGSLDLAAMRDAAARLVGEHDFRNFCKPDVAQVRNFRRTVMSVSLEPVAAAAGGCSALVLNLRGTAFLWHQVRCIAAVLLMVGRGLEPPSIVSSLLDVAVTPAKPQYAFASDLPLLLFDCEFDRLPWVRLGRPLARAASDVKAHLERHLVGAAMCGAVLEALGPDLKAAGVFEAGEGGGDGEGEEGEGEGAAAVLARAAAAAAAAAHVPLLSAARPKEVPLEERFERLGIPVELLNRPGQAGFADAG